LYGAFLDWSALGDELYAKRVLSKECASTTTVSSTTTNGYNVVVAIPKAVTRYLGSYRCWFQWRTIEGQFSGSVFDCDKFVPLGCRAHGYKNVEVEELERFIAECMICTTVKTRVVRAIVKKFGLVIADEQLFVRQLRQAGFQI